VPEALGLSDRGYRVMVGAADDPETYRAARVGSAALVATTLADTANTNVAFTVREIDAAVPIVATCSRSASLDVLRLAGCNEVLQLGHLLGEAMARRVLGAGGRSQVIGRFDELLVAEAAAASTPLVGRTLRDAELPADGLPIIVGMWDRGAFRLAEADTPIGPTTVLVLAGSADQLATWDRDVAGDDPSTGLIVVVGGGRVGRAAGAVLEQAGIEHRIIERRPERIRDPGRYVEGDAADLDVLRRASFDRARAVLLTTHEDDVNVYLAIYCHKLRPDVQVIARANLDRNVSTLHRAGADAVLSYASLGAAAIWNALGPHDALVLAEGLEVFRAPVPPQLAGKALGDTSIREDTRCHVVAVARGDDMDVAPGPATVLPAGSDIVLVGDVAAEHEFLTRYRR
jgi:Trk K+ transport system NAD-binding subunit